MQSQKQLTLASLQQLARPLIAALSKGYSSCVAKPDKQLLCVTMAARVQPPWRPTRHAFIAAMLILSHCNV